MAGSLDTAINNLAILLADSSSFRTATGSANRTAALTHIFQSLVTAPSGDKYTTAELSALRPYALLYSTEYRRSSVAFGQWDEGGSIAVQIVDDIGSSESAIVARNRLITLAAEIIDQMAALAGTAGYIAVTEFSGTDGCEPFLGHPDDVPGAGAAVGVQFECVWQN